MNAERTNRQRAIYGAGLAVLAIVVAVAAYGAMRWGGQAWRATQAGGAAVPGDARRLHRYATGTAELWILVDVGRYVRWTVPIIFVMRATLTIIQYRQARTKVQKSMARIIAGDAAFWGVVWMSFSLRESRLWVIGEIAVYTIQPLTSIEMGYRLLRRYVLENDGDTPARPVETPTLPAAPE